MQPFLVEHRHYARHLAAEPRDLAALAAFNRINALSCIKSAEHGWLGASYSAAEILTTLYFGLDERNVVLSKGHAATMQYACLFGLGQIDAAMLLSYKNGPLALQAHTDRSAPGILINTGSLGQALSKTAGLAVCRPSERFAVVLGDGELQEGQVYEALQTIVHRRLTNVTPIVDCNGFQSELRVEQVKGIADLARVAEGFGFEVESVDGRAPEAITQAWKRRAPLPRLIIAHTIKAGGSRFLAAEGERQVWHGRVPDDALYLRIVEEQVTRAGDDAVSRDWQRYASRATATAPAPKAPGHASCSTRDAFSHKLRELLERDQRLVVLDADLAHSCGLDALTRHPRFYEMGISEQDMVSFAGGLALGGRLPVVNTYAAFLKRAYEQIYVNATEGTKVIYAGHYAGLCYHTDGKTHQAINDLALMLSVPGLVVIEPTLPEQAAALLEWATGAQTAPVYFRLRRTPAAIALPPQPLAVERPLARDGDGRHFFFTMGTVSTGLALRCLEHPRFSKWGLVAQAVLHGPLDRAWYAERLRQAEHIITIEEDCAPGALRSWLSALLSELDLAPRLTGKTISGFGASFRSEEACLEYFGFTPAGIAGLLERAVV